MLASFALAASVGLVGTVPVARPTYFFTLNADDPAGWPAKAPTVIVTEPRGAFPARASLTDLPPQPTWLLRSNEPLRADERTLFLEADCAARVKGDTGALPLCDLLAEEWRSLSPRQLQAGRTPDDLTRCGGVCPPVSVSFYVPTNYYHYVYVANYGRSYDGVHEYLIDINDLTSAAAATGQARVEFPGDYK